MRDPASCLFLALALSGCSSGADSPSFADGGSSQSGGAAGGMVASGGNTSAAGAKVVGGGAPGGSSAVGGGGAGAGMAAGGSSAGASGMATAPGGAGGSGAAGGPGIPGSGGGELPGSACSRDFKAPSFAELKTNSKMPDPFTFLDGTKVQTKEDWICRQKEISVLAQAFIYGPKPAKPETLTATFSGGVLTVDMTSGSRTWKLTVNIKTPSGEGPFPALFDVDAGAPSGVGSIATGLSWLTSNVAAAGSGRSTQGKFYDFHPNSKDTGSLMAWAWAASRIVDGLELTQGHKIDTKKLYGLGCSRNGKTAATMALFDQRIAMVAMQSPGSGTTSGWRPAQAASGSVQRAGQIFGETSWMGEQFGQFGQNVDKLPIDQHAVLALAWPRPLLIREGTNDSWNCPSCVYTTVKYTQLIYEALGSKDAVGFTHYNGGHCAAGGSEWSTTYDAFVKKYLLGDSSVSTAGRFTEDSFTFDKAKWQDGDLAPIP